MKEVLLNSPNCQLYNVIFRFALRVILRGLDWVLARGKDLCGGLSGGANFG